MRIAAMSSYEPVLALLRRASGRLDHAVAVAMRDGDILESVVSMSRAKMEARLGTLLFREVVRNERTLLDILA